MSEPKKQSKGKRFTQSKSKTGINSQELVYGIHAIAAMLERTPERVKQLFIQDNRQDQRMSEVISLAKRFGVSVQLCDRKKLDQMCQNGQHQGVVAKTTGEALWQESDLESLLHSVVDKGEKPLVLVLDGITDPHNLGACLRVANGAGVHAVLAPRGNSASLTAVARKVASGAADVTPFIQVGNLARTFDKLKQSGLWVIGLADKEDAVLFDADLAQPLALVMGAEGKGIRRLTREQCDSIAAIPMLGNVSSLNVSVAAGVCLYECVRQRR